MIAFKDRIEFGETKSLEDAIPKINNCYEKSKCRSETNPDWKGNVKNIRDIYEEFTWSEFKRLFRKQYLSKMYYYDKEK